MTNLSLARAYLAKIQAQLEVLPLLLERGAYSNVVRGAQEVVELALKGMLRQVGIDPPKWHDVGPVLLEHRGRFPEIVAPHLDRLAEISKDLRKDRELALYGDLDLIPTEHYTRAHAETALDGARLAARAAGDLIGPTRVPDVGSRPDPKPSTET